MSKYFAENQGKLDIVPWYANNEICLQEVRFSVPISEWNKFLNSRLYHELVLYVDSLKIQDKHIDTCEQEYTEEVTWVNKVDQTIDKICDYIQRELDGGEVYGNKTQETIKALAMLVEARAQELKAIWNRMECEQENYISLSRK